MCRRVSTLYTHYFALNERRLTVLLLLLIAATIVGGAQVGQSVKSADGMWTFTTDTDAHGHGGSPTERIPPENSHG